MSIAAEPSSRHTADAAATRRELTRLRPGLVAAYDTELAGARAAILGRVLGALDREPLPGLTAREPGTVTIAGRTVRFPAAAAGAFAQVGAGLTVAVDNATGTEIGNGRTGLGRSRTSSGSTAGQMDAERAKAGPGRAVSVEDPGELVRLLWGEVPLATEIDNSVANLALARAGTRAADGTDLGTLEQLVVDGHPLHPCCRTRGGMTVEDVLAYAPEHSPVIRLRRLRVPADRWHGTAEPVLLAHPWQADRLRDRYPWLTDDGETGPARPLMSLRTVAPLDGGPHVKTAVDVQMTSAVRTVSPAAVHNGPVLSALLAGLTADLSLDVLAETGAGAVVVDGEPRRDLAHLVRQAPSLSAGETCVPLAVFAAVPGWLESGLDAYAWWNALCTVLFAPLVTVLDRGVALEAHGQNALVVLRDGRPVRSLYRDFGGVRVSAARLRRAGVEPPPLAGDLPSDDPAELRTKLAAAALGNAAAELIAALSRHRGAEEARLWAITAAAIRGTGTADAGHLLTAPLPVKATTAMRLATDPLDDLWAVLDNPLAA